MTQLHQHKQPNWPDVVIAAAGSQEPFEDVTIITTKSEYVNLAYEAAADLIYRQGWQLTKNLVHTVACTIIAERKLNVREYVRVSHDGITVCIDVPSVEDDEVSWKALDRLAQALDSLDGNSGTVHFSDDIQYSLTEISSLLHND